MLNDKNNISILIIKIYFSIEFSLQKWFVHFYCRKIHWNYQNFEPFYTWENDNIFHFIYYIHVLDYSCENFTRNFQIFFISQETIILFKIQFVQCTLVKRPCVYSKMLKIKYRISICLKFVQTILKPNIYIYTPLRYTDP